MSLAVAAVSALGAGLATDSIRVDLATSEITYGFVKQVHRGTRAATFTGVCAWGGPPVADWLGTALSEAPRLGDVPGLLVQVAGSGLKDAYSEWRRFVGPNARPEGFLAVLAVSMENGVGQALDVWTVEDSGVLTFRGGVHAPEHGTTILASGSVDDTLYGYTPQGRNTARAAELQQIPVGIVTQQVVTAQWDSHECAQNATRLVADAISRESQIARPPWWPRGVPLMAPPVHQFKAP